MVFSIKQNLREFNTLSPATRSHPKNVFTLPNINQLKAQNDILRVSPLLETGVRLRHWNQRYSLEGKSLLVVRQTLKSKRFND